MSSLSEIVAPAGSALGFLTALCDASFDSVCLCDTDSKIVYTNPAFSRLTGYPLEAVRGKNPKILQGAGTDSRVLERLTTCLKDGEGSFEGKAVNYKLDGTAFIMHWRVVPVRVDGAIKFWLAIQREAGSTA